MSPDLEYEANIQYLFPNSSELRFKIPSLFNFFWFFFNFIRTEEKYSISSSGCCQTKAQKRID